MKNKKNLSENLPKVISVLFFCLAVIAFSLFFLRKDAFIDVRIFITEREEAKYWLNYPDGFSMNNIFVGMSYKNELGQELARISNVYRINTAYQHEIALVTLHLKATFNNKTQSYSFQGQPLVVGGYRSIELSGAQISGYVTDVGENLPPLKEKYYVVSGEFEDEKEATRGINNTKVKAVSKEIIQNVSKESAIVDSLNRIVVEVLDIQTRPAVRVEYMQGTRYSGVDPELISGKITVKLLTQEIDGHDYWNFVLPVQVGQIIDLNFDKAILPFRITSIDSIEDINDEKTHN